MHERYTLLQTKVTDMDFHPITHMNAFKVQEVAPNFVQINAMIGAPLGSDDEPEDLQQPLAGPSKNSDSKRARK